MKKKDTSNQTLQQIFEIVDKALEGANKATANFGESIIVGYDHLTIETQRSLITGAIRVLNEASEVYEKLLSAKPCTETMQAVMELFKASEVESAAKLLWLKKEGIAENFKSMKISFVLACYDYPADVDDLTKQLQSIAAGYVAGYNVNIFEYFNEKKGRFEFTEADEAALMERYAIWAGEKEIRHITALYLLATAMNNLGDIDDTYSFTYWPDIPTPLYKSLRPANNGKSLELNLEDLIRLPGYVEEFHSLNIEYVGVNKKGLPMVNVTGKLYEFKALSFSGLKGIEQFGYQHGTIVDCKSLALPKNRGMLIAAVTQFIRNGGSTIFGPVDPEEKERTFNANTQTYITDVSLGK